MKQLKNNAANHKTECVVLSRRVRPLASYSYCHRAGMQRDPSDVGEDKIVLSEEDEVVLHEQLVERHEAQRQRDYETADRIRECVVHSRRRRDRLPLSTSHASPAPRRHPEQC